MKLSSPFVSKSSSSFLSVCVAATSFIDGTTTVQPAESALPCGGRGGGGGSRPSMQCFSGELSIRPKLGPRGFRWRARDPRLPVLSTPACVVSLKKEGEKQQVAQKSYGK